MARLAQLVTVAVVPIALSACVASLDLDRFKKAEADLTEGDASITYLDVRFSAKGMNSHLNEYFEIRLVDRENRLQAKAVYADVAQPDFSIYLKGVLPRSNAPHRLDFWADHNATQKYDGIEGGINEKDHAWRRVLGDPLPEDVAFVNNVYSVNFIHDTAFVDIFTDLQGNPIPGTETLLPLSLKVVGAGAYVGKMLEIRVVDKASGRLVALHRRGHAAEEYMAQITGVLDGESPYELSVYVDANDDGKFSAGDPSWKLDVVSSGVGLDAEVNVATLPQTPIDTGEK